MLLLVDEMRSVGRWVGRDQYYSTDEMEMRFWFLLFE